MFFTYLYLPLPACSLGCFGVPRVSAFYNQV
jgi:hypothetical protein